MVEPVILPVVRVEHEGNTPRYTDDQVHALVDAMAQLLDDMGAHDLNKCVCLAAKAQARVAYEPFRDLEDDDDWLMPLDRAKAVLKECDY